MELIRLENVKKIYQTGEVITKAVDGIDFTVDQGEFALIIGASGAGKTTVLNILGGMDTATSGAVYIDGEDISKWNKKQLTGYRRDDIGFVFQFYNLVPNLTATENVELALQISKNPLKAEEVLKDEEGMQTMRTLGNNMAWLLKSIEAGKKAGIKLPENESIISTNFIR